MGRTNRVPIMMSVEEMAAIDDWRFANRVATRSDAVRRLVQIGAATHKEMERLTRERDELREKLSVEMFGKDAAATVADLARQWTKEILKTNCTFVDDDLRLLAHLANRAVEAGLTDTLPDSVLVDMKNDAALQQGGGGCVSF